MYNLLIKNWKTTIIGMILFISGIVYTFMNDSPDYIILSILLISGIAFIFFPDDFIKQIKQLIIKKTNDI